MGIPDDRLPFKWLLMANWNQSMPNFRERHTHTRAHAHSHTHRHTHTQGEKGKKGPSQRDRKKAGGNLFSLSFKLKHWSETTYPVTEGNLNHQY